MKISPSYMRFYVTVLATLLAFSLRDIFAQDLGELARQERAKRQTRQSRVTKVFTNEDLKRDVIINDEERVVLAATEPATAPTDDPASVPIHLTLAAPALPGKQPESPVKNFAERAVPTVPLWPSAMPLGDVARYYRQQVAPALPSIHDAVMAEALAHAPALRDFAADKLHMTFAALPEPAAPAPPMRPALRELDLPAPFVLASAEGTRVPVIENVGEQTVPAFPSPSIQLHPAESETVVAAAATRTEGLRFEAPQLGDVILTFDPSSGAAALGVSAIAGEQSATPMFDSSREPLMIRFKAPEPLATAPRPAPLARTEQSIVEPQLRATITSTSSLDTVSPWRYADEMPPAPVKFEADPARALVVSTSVEAKSAAEELVAELTSVEEAETLEVRVASGDSLWKLAARHLGDGNAWPRIAAANPQLSNPNRILAGELLAIPGATGAVAAAPASKPVVASTNAGKSVTVRKGDSLWKLAETALGTGAAWSCIAEANPQIANADRILAGQTLILPTSCNPQS